MKTKQTNKPKNEANKQQKPNQTNNNLTPKSASHENLKKLRHTKSWLLECDRIKDSKRKE